MTPPRASGGGPVVVRQRRSTVGWAALLCSLAVHSLIAGVAAWWWIGGQGNAGDLGMELQEAEATAPAFRTIAKTEPTSEAVHIRAAHSFKPMRSPILLAATHEAELTMPKWDMPSSQPITAPPPATVVDSTPVADATPHSSPAKPPTQAKRKAAPGSGASGGMGNHARAGEQPKLVSSSPPIYPANARRDGAQGIAYVKVSLTSAGRVAECSIYRSTGNTALDTAALKTVRNWRFTPTSDGTEVLVTVTFKLT